MLCDILPGLDVSAGAHKSASRGFGGHAEGRHLIFGFAEEGTHRGGFRTREDRSGQRTLKYFATATIVNEILWARGAPPLIGWRHRVRRFPPDGIGLTATPCQCNDYGPIARGQRGSTQGCEHAASRGRQPSPLRRTPRPPPAPSRGCREQPMPSGRRPSASAQVRGKGFHPWRRPRSRALGRAS